jgi:V/A-type H+/Na+-transporting ATPase subunit C
MSQGLYSESRLLGENKAKLVLGKYPYTYARISVMRSVLFKRDDYNKLLKLNINEMIGFLESSPYKQEIDLLGVKYHGVQLMELALNKNLSNTWLKLKRISKSSLKLFVSVYLIKADIWNIKSLIRAKYTGMDIAQLQVTLLPVGFLGEKKLAELAKKNSVEEILKGIGFIGSEYFAYALESYRNSKSISEIENALDRFFHSVMASLSKKIPNSGKHLKEFLEGDLEMTAIMNILRLKRANTPPNEIARIIIIPSSSKTLFGKMIFASSATEAAKLLEKSNFRLVVENGVKDFLTNGSLVILELDLSRYLLKKSILLLHKHPLTVDVILGYMFAKEIEVRNLRLLLKGKQLGLGEDFISQQIITT